MTAFFITFEGGEGSGKTTQITRLAEHLTASGFEVLATREPGGSPGAEALREIILSGAAEALGPDMETILFAAARMDHVTEVIRPALDAGKIVLCDRFHDSTRVYQGLAGTDATLIETLEAAALAGLYPDLTIVLDVEAAEGLARARARRGGKTADRFEREDVAVHEARRQEFLAIAAAEPERCVVVDAMRPADAIAEDIALLVSERLERPARGAQTGPALREAGAGAPGGGEASP